MTAGLNRTANALAAVRAARDYGYSSPAAFDAATEALLSLSRADLIGVVGILAVLLSDMKPAPGGLGVDDWLDAATVALTLHEPGQQ